MAGTRSLQATVEDCHSTDESDHDSGINESFRRSPAAASGQANVGANVAARRSQPSDLNGEREPLAEKVANIDLQSDSGYSSHTAATMSSADSGPSAKSHSPPTAPATAAPPPSASPAGKRRPTLSSREERHSSENSTRKPLARSGSVSSRNRPRRERQSSTSKPCTDPNWDQCPGSRGRRPKPSPLDSGVNVSYTHPFDDQRSQRSQRSDPAPSTTSYASPQSPTYPRQPGAYFHGSTVVLPAQTSRPRRSSSVARPVSFAGEPSQGYWAGMPPPGQYPPQAHEPHGPPPSMSAYHNVQLPPMGAYGMMGASPSNGGFYAPPPMQMHNPQYDMQRPPMHSRTSSNFNARRPASQVYGQPAVLTQDPGNMPSARYPPNVPSSATQRYFPRSPRDHDDDDDDDDDDDEDSSSASDYTEDEDTRRALMPPPKSKPSAQRQPSHQQSSSRSERRKSLMSQSLTLEPERESRKSRVSTTAAPSRSASKARPRPTTLVHQPKAQSAFETSRTAKVMVEDSRSRRRQSYQGQVYEKEYRDERRQRVYPDRPSSRVYRDQDEDADVIVPRQRRRPTDASLRNEVPTSSRLRDVANDVEAYQQRTRGSDAPLNDHIHRAAKRGSRINSGPSEAGSSRSKGSDKASRVSQSARTTVTNGGGGELRLRVDGSARLQFNGDMEGRTLQICPGEDGMAEIVIADNRGHESAYRSDRGSVLDRKTVVSRTERIERSERPERGSERARREAEEVSTRSSRSSQSRRDRERDVETRPLRRREKLYRE